MGSLKEALSIERHRLFVGRQTELGYMHRWLQDAAAQSEVVFLSGMGGIGKSALVHKFLDMAQDAGLLCVWVDGRNCTATPAGFLDTLGSYIVEHYNSSSDIELSMSQITRLLSTQRTLLCIDNYEELHHIDGWFRQIFLPELPAAGFLTVLASRQDVSFDWKSNLAWANRVVQMPLAPVSRLEAKEYYVQRGIENRAEVDILFRETKGLPLAMAVSADSTNRMEIAAETHESSVSRFVSASLLREVATSNLHDILDVLCIVSQANQILLNQLLEHPVTPKDIEQLSQLSFIRPTRMGFALHDIARAHLLDDFRRREPERHDRLRRHIIDEACKALKTAKPRVKTRIAAELLSMCRELLPLEPLSRSSTDLVPRAMDAFRDSDLPYLHGLITEQNELHQLAISLEIERVHELLDAVAYQFPDSIRVFRSATGIPLGFNSGLLLYRETMNLFEQFLPHVLDACFAQESYHMRQLRLEEADTYYQLMAAATALDADYSFDDLNGMFVLDSFSRTAAIGMHTFVVTKMQDVVDFLVNLGYRRRPMTGLPETHPAYHDVILDLDFRSADFGKWVQSFLAGGHQAPPNKLSTRELEVVELVCQGLSNSEIAKKLVISRRTVDAHLRKIFEKVGVTSRASLASWATKIGLHV